MRMNYPLCRHPRSRFLRLSWLAALLALPLSGVASEDTPELAPGVQIERPLAAQATARYPVTLSAGEFFRAVVVEEDGIDVEVRLLDPEGRLVRKVDGPSQPRDDEDLAAIVEQPGLYHLEIQASPRAGRYRLRIERRPAGEVERAWVEAVELSQAATEAMSTSDEASLLKQVQQRSRALALWHWLGERGHEASNLFQLGVLHFNLADFTQAADDLHRS
ncbi:MAG TPA: hypothetical protein VMM92_04525, partial [Thermoanaerobaculia bacterium]|nr:hypothetical protein [Thermoanaerobaculia bacterium]